MNSFIENVNYLASLDNNYGDGIVLNKNNLSLRNVANDVTLKFSYFNYNTKQIETVDKIINGMFYTGLETALQEFCAKIESSLGGNKFHASFTIYGHNISITINSLDEKLKCTEINFNAKITSTQVEIYNLYGDVINPLKLLSVLAMLEPEVVDAIPMVYENIDSIIHINSNTDLLNDIKNNIIPNINEILEADNNALIASQKALDASASASNALDSENKAEKWASESEDVEVETGEYSAKHWALKSKELSAGVALNISYDNTESGLSSSTTQDAIDELDNNLDNLSANVYTKSEINSSLATKVDKVIGKQLSTEDFTTFEKNKLIGIAIGANNYTLPAATSTKNGGVELYSDTVQTVASNEVTNTASRTYGLQFNSAGQAVVNVPWVDTNTVYTHPTTDGSLHVPATSTTNNGKVLMAGATAGVFAWSTLPNVTTTTAGYMLAADKVKLDGIAVNANNYVHPSTHDASIIAVTDTFNNSNGSTVQIVLDDLDNAIDVQKGRIDALLTASTADKDTFSEIVTLINSVDTTNDTVFAGYVDTNNTRSTTIETNITNLTNNKVDKTNIQALHATDALRVSGKTISLYKGDGTFETIGTQDTVYTHPVSGATAGTYKSVTVDINGHVTSGTNPTTVSGYGLTDVYTKTEVNSMIPTTLPASDVYAWAKVATKPTYTASEVGLGNVTNESKSTMFTSPTFTGTPVAGTAAVGTNTTQVATTAFVVNEINKIEEW